MKNLIRKGLEYLEEISSKDIISKELGWHSRKYNYRNRTINGYTPYRICQRVIENNIGKSFDSAFSYYCKLVTKRDQRFFLEEFERNRELDPYYFIDEEGMIQINKDSFWHQYKQRKSQRRKDKFYITTPDYKTEKVHKITGHKFSDFLEVYDKKIHTYKRKRLDGTYYEETYTSQGALLYLEYGAKFWKMKPLHERYVAKESDFHHIIVKGDIEYFDSKKDPRFVRHYYEKRKETKKINRIKRIEQEQKLYSFISRSEEEAKKEKEKNRLNILKHGFDPTTSFRTNEIYQP